MNDKLPYRPNVGIMVLNGEGKVWIGHRAHTPNTEYSGRTQLWQMPQGGVDEGEDVYAAALRELYEETGMKSIELIGKTEDWIRYDFPPDVPKRLKNKWSGQKQMWFAFRFTGNENEIQIDPPPDGHEAEFDKWRWEDMTALPDLVVSFKREVYVQVVEVFSKLLDQEI